MNESKVDQELRLAQYVWFAGLTTTYKDYRPLSGQLNDLIDIDKTLDLIHFHTLDRACQIPIGTLCTMMIGISRAIASKTLKLNHITAQECDTIWHVPSETLSLLSSAQSQSVPRCEHSGEMAIAGDLVHIDKTDDDCDRYRSMIGHKNNNNDKQNNKRTKMQRDKQTQLTMIFSPNVHQIRDTLRAGEIVPNFGFSNTHSAQIHRERMLLMQRPVRRLPSKLTYLFVRNANVHLHRRRQQQQQPKKRSDDKRRSLTCDLCSSGKRVRSSYLSVTVEPKDNIEHTQLSSFHVAEHCIGTTSSTTVASSSSSRSTYRLEKDRVWSGDGTLVDLFDHNHPLLFNVAARCRCWSSGLSENVVCSSRSSSHSRNRDRNINETATIKSIKFGFTNPRSISSFKRIRLDDKKCNEAFDSTSTTSSFANQLNVVVETLTRLLAAERRRSVGHTIELQNLIYAAADAVAASAASRDDSSRPRTCSCPLTKQVAAIYFVILLKLLQ